MKKKIILSIVILITSCGSLGFYNYYHQIKNNEAGICTETGTRLSEQELRSRVIENLLWQMLKETDADKNSLINRSIAVVNRHISKEEIIAAIENSSGKQFIQDIINNPETVLFQYSDVYLHPPPDSTNWLIVLFFSINEKYKDQIKRYPVLIDKVAKAKTIFNGNFSIVTYDKDYEKPWFQEKHEYGGGISVISGNTIFLDNDGFRNKFRNFSISGDKVNYIVENKYDKKGYSEITKTMVDNVYNHACGQFFYQYHPDYFDINYNNDLYSNINNKKIDDEKERNNKIQKAKNERIRLINESYSRSPRFFAVSNCGDILEYYIESMASGYDEFTEYHFQ